MVWKFEKFEGDMAIYATCPQCGYTYNVTTNPIFTEDNYKIDRQYKYCPECGKYLYNENEKVDVTWNKRHISQLYEKV